MKNLLTRCLSVLLCGALLSLSLAPHSHRSLAESSVDLIVQATSQAALSQLEAAIESQGGTVSRSLHVINALAVRAPRSAVPRLERLPAVGNVWPDAGVRSSDSADPGMIHPPTAAMAYEPEDFDLDKVRACDGRREKLKIGELDLHVLDPNVHQAYAFASAVDPGNVPSAVSVRTVFKEKKLATAQLQVWQHSAQAWRAFDIDTLASEDEIIDETLDISSALPTPEDLADVRVRFTAARADGGEKAEVDCVLLMLHGYPSGAPDTLHSPVAGRQYKGKPLDAEKFARLDGDKEQHEKIPLAAVDEGIFQAYRFTANVDPADLPELIDLRIVFKEKKLGEAHLAVHQASTGIWHRLEIDTTGSDDTEIDATFDLTGILEAPEDFADVAVRLYAARLDGGEKAEVNLVNLRMGSLVGDTALDVSEAFEAVNAAPVWTAGNKGAGVGIAVLDTGVKKYKELEYDSQGKKTGYVKGWSALTGKDGKKDKNGHGTIVASVASNHKSKHTGEYFGIAPDSVIIPIQVLDEDGQGSYSGVIAGIQWAIENKDAYNIRVMNLSLSAPVRSHYWDDPLNQATMRAWQAGIVVVAAAGNSGPDPMTIGVPANNPYVISVGALTDAYTPGDWSDDYVPTFSSAGPTFEGFVKPDLVAPGGHVLGLMSEKGKLAKKYPQYKVDKDYYQLSGTSMSAAQVSGIVALMLAHIPYLSPDEVKYRLIASAQPAVSANGTALFNIWQQGAGRANAFFAVYGDYSGAANQGLNIDADLAGTQHFQGYSRWDPHTGQFYLVDDQGHAWSEAHVWGGGHAWSEAFVWGGGHAWSEALVWGGGHAWSEVLVWGDGHAWSESIDWHDAFATLVNWVDQE